MNNTGLPYIISLLWQVFSMCFVTKATPTHSIDGNSRIKKQSCITCATRYYGLILRKWLFITLGVDTHTHKHTCILMSQAKAISAPGLKIETDRQTSLLLQFYTIATVSQKSNAATTQCKLRS